MVSSMNFAALKHGVTIETSGESGSDIAGINAARDADVGGAFDDRAAIGKDGQLVGIENHAQSELVGAHKADAAELAGEIAKVDGARAFMNLDGVAAAQADRRPPS